MSTEGSSELQIRFLRLLLTRRNSLKARHVQFIALGGAIGTGLFLGIGQALYNYGPLSILLGYAITGLFIYFMMLALVSWFCACTSDSN